MLRSRATVAPGAVERLWTNNSSFWVFHLLFLSLGITFFFWFTLLYTLACTQSSTRCLNGDGRFETTALWTATAGMHVVYTGGKKCGKCFTFGTHKSPSWLLWCHWWYLSNLIVWHANSLDTNIDNEQGNLILNMIREHEVVVVLYSDYFSLSLVPRSRPHFDGRCEKCSQGRRPVVA